MADNINVGDWMMFDGGKQYYTGSGWTSNAPGTMGTDYALGSKVADPYANAPVGQFNAAGYGEIPGTSLPSTGQAALGGQANTIDNTGRTGGRGGVTTAPSAISPPPVANITDPPYEGQQPFGPPQATGVRDPLRRSAPTSPSTDPRSYAATTAAISGLGGRNNLSVQPATPYSTQQSGPAASGGGNLPPGYWNSTGQGGMFNFTSPTFDTYWQQRLNELKSPFITPQAWVSGIQGYSTNNPTASLTPAAQWATEYATAHPDDPMIAALGGVQAFVNKYNAPEYSLQTLRPDLAKVSGGYGSGVAGSWQGLGNEGKALLSYGVENGMQPSFDASPADIVNSLRLRGIDPNSAIGQQALGYSNNNLLNSPNTGAKANGATPYVNQLGQTPLMSGNTSAASAGGTQTPVTSSNTNQPDNNMQALYTLIQQLLGGQSSSSVGTNQLGYTEWNNPTAQSSSNDQNLQLILALLSSLNQSQPRQTNYWGY